VQQKSPTADAEGLFDHQVEQRGGKSKHFDEDLRSIGSGDKSYVSGDAGKTFLDNSADGNTID
jgi:hypothetical protein